MIDFEKLKHRACGRWFGILTSLGVSDTYLTGKHGPCIFCGGKDRWRWDNKDGEGTYFCNQCGAGDGFSLVMKYFNIYFPEALKKIQSIIGGCEKMPDKKPSPDPRLRLNKVWSSSTPLTGSDPVSKYLHSRGIVLLPDNVRYCAKCYEPDSKTEMPAMVARIQNAEGKPVSLHRTYLDGDKKADIDAPKKIMPGIESLCGCAIRLFPTDSPLFKTDELGIAEGIETAMSAAQIFQMPVWAAISTSIMEAWMPPEGVKKITIFSDSDANYAGQKAAFTLANKLYNKDFIVQVEMPAGIGADFNDILLER